MDHIDTPGYYCKILFSVTKRGPHWHTWILLQDFILCQQTWTTLTHVDIIVRFYSLSPNVDHIDTRGYYCKILFSVTKRGPHWHTWILLQDFILCHQTWTTLTHVDIIVRFYSLSPNVDHIDTRGYYCKILFSVTKRGPHWHTWILLQDFIPCHQTWTTLTHVDIIARFYSLSPNVDHIDTRGYYCKILFSVTKRGPHWHTWILLQDFILCHQTWTTLTHVDIIVRFYSLSPNVDHIDTRGYYCKILFSVTKRGPHWHTWILL